MRANNVVDAFGALKACRQHVSIERALRVVRMMHMAAFRLCGPARTVKRDDFSRLRCASFFVVVDCFSRTSARSDTMACVPKLPRGRIQAFELTPCVKYFEFVEM